MDYLRKKTQQTQNHKQIKNLPQNEKQQQKNPKTNPLKLKKFTECWRLA